MNKSIHEIFMVGVFFLGLCSLKAVIDFIRQRATVKFLKKSDIQLTTSIFKKLINAPLSYFNSQNTGEIISKIANVDSLRNLFSFVVNNLIINAIFAGALFVMVFNISWIFLVITLLQVLFNLSLYIFNEQKIKKYQVDLSVKDSDIQSSLIDLSKGIEEIKVYNLENKLNEEIDKKYSDYAEFNTDFSLFLSKKQILGDYFSKMFLVVSLIIGYIMMINNEIDVGELVGYVYINNSLVSVCSQLVNNFPMIEQARVAFFRLSEILNQKDKEKQELKEGIQDIEKIEVENLEYRYNYKKKIFSDIAIQINKSEKIAIMGPTGCGKTTLAKIISGLFSDKGNSVRINGQSIQDIDDKSLKENIIYVSQFPNFFAGTIYENIIALNDSDYNFVEVEKLVKKLDMNDIFVNHAYGIHSKLSENGSNLSGGQRQKLSLLRAFIKKPKVLVLDEATSNLDLKSEKKVIDYLLSLKDTTVIFISHKKYLNDYFDKVYEFNNGKLIEQGV